MSTESETEETTTPNDYAKVPQPKEFKIGYGVYVTLSNKWDPKDSDKKGKIDELIRFIEKNKDDGDKQKLIANIKTVIQNVNKAKKILDAAAEKYKIAVKDLHKNYKNKEIKSSDDSKVSGFFGLKRKFQKATASREYIKQRTNTPIIKLNVSNGVFEYFDKSQSSEDQRPGAIKAYTFKEAVSIGFDIKHFLDNKSEENAKELVNQFLSYSSLFKNDKKKKGKTKKEPTPQEDSPEFKDLIKDAGLGNEEIAALRSLLSVPITSESLMESEEQNDLLKKLLVLAASKNMSNDQKKLIKSAFEKLKNKGKIQQLQNLYDEAAPKKEPESTIPEPEQKDSEETDTEEIEVTLENMKEIFDQNKLSLVAIVKAVPDDNKINKELSYKIPIKDAIAFNTTRGYFHVVLGSNGKDVSLQYELPSYQIRPKDAEYEIAMFPQYFKFSYNLSDSKAYPLQIKNKGRMFLDKTNKIYAGTADSSKAGEVVFEQRFHLMTNEKAQEIQLHPGFKQEKLTIEKFIEMRKSGKEDFSNLDMSGLDFQNTGEKATLININFSNANLEKANLKDVFCSNSNFSEANLSNADLSGANLGEADLSGADLSNADLDNAFITNAILASANLQIASLIGTVLDNSDLKDANLEGANLKRAFLSNANLSGANLKNANFTKAKYNDETTWPKDFDPVEKGAIREQESLQERLERLIKPYLKQRLRNKRRV